MALSSHDKDIPFPIFWGGEHQVFRGMVPFRIRASLSFVGESTEDYGRKNEAKKTENFPHLQGIHEELMKAWEKRNYK